MYGLGRRGGGIASVSKEIGNTIYRKLAYHDDGVFARGGVMGTIIGKRGTGKTTFLNQYAQSVMHYPTNIRNRSLLHLLQPETVIARGRSYDYWTSLDPEYWKKVMNYKNPKPLFIHNWIGNEHYQFVTDYDGKREEITDSDFDFMTYDTIEELIENIQPGAANIIYEPGHFILPEDFAHQLAIRKIHIKRSNKEQDPNAKSTPIIQKYDPVEVPPSTFWYPFLDKLMKLKNREDFITVILDDANMIFEEGASDMKWHMIESFVASIIDLRRLNISLMLSIHETSLMHWKVRRRSDYMVFLRGAVPDEKISRVVRNLPASLNIGQALLEDPGIEFGIMDFARLDRQPPMVNVLGCENYS